VENHTLARRPVDQLIAGLCGSIAELRERCKTLEDVATSRGQDASGYERLAKQALHALHREQSGHEKLRTKYDRLVCEYRAHRERCLQDTCNGNLRERAA
jgi:hypothetical protein